MSNSHLFMPSGFPRAPLQNGLGRYVCQLQRLTIKFCKHHGDSRGIREFIEHDLFDFAKAYPGVVLYVKPRRHRAPCLSAEYLNGGNHYVSCHNFSRDEVSKWVSLLRTQGGGPTMRFRKLWHTDNPSIQGPWSPFYHRDPQLNLVTFPKEDLSRPLNVAPSATEQLQEIFKRQKGNMASIEQHQVE